MRRPRFDEDPPPAENDDDWITQRDDQVMALVRGDL